MYNNGFEGQKGEINTRLADLREKAVNLPAEQQNLMDELLDDVARLLDEAKDTPKIPSDIALLSETNAVNDQDLLDEIPCLIWRSGLDAKCYFFNRTWLQFTGRTLEQEKGDGWTDGVHPEDIDRVALIYLNSFSARQPFEMQYRLRHFSGEYRWILDIGRPVLDRAGQFTGYIGTCFDLTDQKQMEHALKDSESMFRGLFDFAPDALVAVDQHGKIVYINNQVEQMFGYNPDELLGQAVELLMPEQSKQKHRQHVSGFMAAPSIRPMGRRLELMGRRRNGSLFPVDITLGPLDTREGQIVLAAVRDKTEYKEAEEAIREKDKLIQTALSVAPTVFFRVDATGIIRYSAGKSHSRAETGVEPVGKSIYDLYRSNPLVIKYYERALRGETFTATYEVSNSFYIVSYSPLYDDKGEVNGVVGVATDITAFRQVEDELRNSQARFRTIFDQAHLGMVLINLNGQVMESNPAFEQMLGCETIELQQMRFTDLIHATDTREMRRTLRKLFSGKSSHVSVEHRFVRTDGETIWGRVSMSLMRTEEGQPMYIVCMVENITYQKQMSAELIEVQRRLIDSRETERLHLSQELHDGPLQELQSVSFVLSALHEENIQQGPIEQAQESVSEMMRSLRVICGELRPPTLAPFGLEKAIRSYINQIREQHPNLEIYADLQEDGQALPEHIRLALFRILQHTLKNTVKHAHASQVTVIFSFDEDEIRLEVQDNGRGFRVPKRWVELVREGHFGLVGANERARAIGGEFNIESRPGQGTVVSVLVSRQMMQPSEPQSPMSLLISQ
jgi:PAS domain S-box-containing protein